MGMSVQDFCSMTPDEFRAAHRSWTEREESHMRSGWEMTRTISMFFLQPYSKKRLNPSDVMKFPWDGAQEEKRKSPPMKSTEGRFLKMKEMLETGYLSPPTSME